MNEKIIRKYVERLHNNNESLSNVMSYHFDIFYTIFNSKIKFDNDEQKEYIMNIYIEIINNKMFGSEKYIDDFIHKKNAQLFYLEKNKLQYDPAIDIYITQLNNFADMFDSQKELNEEICKRIDLYGFGIIILECIRYCVTKTKIEINLILKLFEFIHMCCCPKNKYISYNKIVNSFKQIISARVKGGMFFNQGSFGKVYGNPRIPCKNETQLLKSFNNEVSKVFFEDKDAYTEFGIINRLSKYLSKEQIIKIQQYVVIPLDLCKINKNIIKSEPYVSNNYYKNSSGISKDKTRLKDMNMEIIYPRGDMDLYDVFELNKEPIDVHLYKCLNILEGLQYIHKLGFMHGDLKPNNCISIENTYKMIDLDTMCYYKNNNNYTKQTLNHISNGFSYLFYPSGLTTLLKV
jgi:hypothetical protein